MPHPPRPPDWEREQAKRVLLRFGVSLTHGVLTDDDRREIQQRLPNTTYRSKGRLRLALQRFGKYDKDFFKSVPKKVCGMHPLTEYQTSLLSRLQLTDQEAKRGVAIRVILDLDVQTDEHIRTYPLDAIVEQINDASNRHIRTDYIKTVNRLFQLMGRTDIIQWNSMLLLTRHEHDWLREHSETQWYLTFRRYFRCWFCKTKVGKQRHFLLKFNRALSIIRQTYPNPTDHAWTSSSETDKVKWLHRAAIKTCVEALKLDCRSLLNRSFGHRNKNPLDFSKNGSREYHEILGLLFRYLNLPLNLMMKRKLFTLRIKEELGEYSCVERPHKESSLTTGDLVINGCGHHFYSRNEANIRKLPGQHGAFGVSAPFAFWDAHWCHLQP